MSSVLEEYLSIMKEMDSIISELDSISSGVRKDFVGIGNEECANCINGVINQFYAYKDRMKDMDIKIVNFKIVSEGGGQGAFGGGGGGSR